MDGITDAMDVNLGKLRETVRGGGLACYSPWMESQRVRHDCVTKQQATAISFCSELTPLPLWLSRVSTSL